MNISELLQNANVPIVALVCGGMCLLSLVLVVVLPILTGTLQIFGSIIDIFTGIIGAFTGILSGGPVAWCGCLFFLIVLMMCGGMALLIAGAISSCGTPNQMLFCRLF
ncbi:MAG TPA: hypothetical protein PLZ51_12470 [Aggregatilineales bacterium]|nr:hypothetical protein [Aggregatilineales bacterium]